MYITNVGQMKCYQQVLGKYMNVRRRKNV